MPRILKKVSPAVAGVQVILKPDPGNSQELYLGSLAALGEAHRIAPLYRAYCPVV